MAIETSPAFQFFVKEWRSSRAVQRMRMQVRGMYLEMLLEQWESLSLPDCPRAVYDIIGGPDPVEDWIAAWPELRRKFVDRRDKVRSGDALFHDATDCDPTRRVVNLRLEKVRREQKAYKRSKKIAGRAGGLSKARNRQTSQQLQPAQNIAPLESATSADVAKRSSASATATPSAIATPSATAGRPAALASSKHPIFTGQRLTVFEWFLSKAEQVLGAHLEAFDIHAWFFDVDTKAAQSGLVIPSRDNGAWLESQLIAEAQKRGLPVAVAGPVLGKQTTKLASALANITAEARR